jgi:hypothetical protein
MVNGTPLIKISRLVRKNMKCDFCYRIFLPGEVVPCDDPLNPKCPTCGNKLTNNPPVLNKVEFDIINLINQLVDKVLGLKNNMIF